MTEHVKFLFYVFKGIIQLEKELANLGGACAAALMKKDLALPVGMCPSKGADSPLFVEFIMQL